VDPPVFRDFHRRDTVNAFKYINRSIAIDPKYAEAYVLASDILSFENGADGKKEALNWLNRGIAANPTDSSLYITSAELLAITDADAAVNKLKELKEKDPNFPVDLQLGRLYYQLWDKHGMEPYAEMAASYDKVRKEDMTVGDLEAYSFALYATNQIDKMYDVSAYGAKIAPESFMLKLNEFYGLLGLKKFSEAVVAGENFIKNTAPSKLQPIHYLRYGEALNGVKRYEEAIAQYDFVLKMENASENNITTAYNHIASTMEAKVNDYIKDGDYQTAASVYEEFLNSRRAINKVDASMLSMYAGIYMSWAKKLSGPEQKDTYMKADAIYTEMGEKFPKFDDLAYANRMQIRTTLDPEFEEGLAIPFAENLAKIILAKGSDLTDGQTKRLVSAYWVQCYYYAANAKKKNKALCLSFADKILDIDPTNAQALKIYEIVSKWKR
jgi:tetratricopeptide (TPR) repeat protein